jgi:hypothetical protein
MPVSTRCARFPPVAPAHARLPCRGTSQLPSTLCPVAPQERVVLHSGECTPGDLRFVGGRLFQQ